ncbi:hypothetical protein ACLOJK_022745, partial [Asimina triloba]
LPSRSSPEATSLPSLPSLFPSPLLSLDIFVLDWLSLILSSPLPALHDCCLSLFFFPTASQISLALLHHRFKQLLFLTAS